MAAAHAVLRAYVPAEAAALDAARASSLAGIPEGPAKAKGLLAGESAAAAVMALRADDGSLPPQFHLPGSTAPGEWQLTPGCPPAGGILLHWRQVRPFGIARSDQFRSAPPPPLGSRRYASDYTEVRSVGDAASLERPPDRADVARFYNVALAVATWNPAVRQVAASRGATIAENARTFALLNMAISDALVSVMETKYPLSRLAPAHRDPPRRGRRQPEDDGGLPTSRRTSRHRASPAIPPRTRPRATPPGRWPHASSASGTTRSR